MQPGWEMRSLSEITIIPILQFRNRAYENEGPPQNYAALLSQCCDLGGTPIQWCEYGLARKAGNIILRNRPNERDSRQQIQNTVFIF